MAYVDFGTLGKIAAAADTSGQNTGNLTTTFIPTQKGLRLSQFVIYHMVLTNLTLGAQATIKLNADDYSGFGPATAGQREWFGTLYMKSSDELRFYWNLASSTTPVPTLTCYIIYDPELPGNAGMAA